MIKLYILLLVTICSCSDSDYGDITGVHEATSEENEKSLIYSDTLYVTEKDTVDINTVDTFVVHRAVLDTKSITMSDTVIIRDTVLQDIETFFDGYIDLEKLGCVNGTTVNVATLNASNFAVYTSVTTDEKGYFCIQNIPQGDYNIELKRSTYDTYTFSLSVDFDTVIHLDTLSLTQVIE